MPAFREHINDLLELTSQDAGGEAENMVRRALNNAYRKVLGAVGQEQSKREFSFSVTASVAQWGLPLYIRNVLNVDDGVNDFSLIEFTAEEYDKLLPGDTSEGTPTHYYPVGNFGVQLQPSANGTITFVSDSTSDSSTTYITVTGYDSNGVLIREKNATNGTTDVTTTASFTTIERLVKSADSGISWVGNVAVSDASANVLARIPTWIDSPTYQWIRFWHIPSAAFTYTIRANAYKPDLVNNEDWPDFDDHYHDLLTFIAGSVVLPTLGKPDVGLLYNQYAKDLMNEFLGSVDRKPNAYLVSNDVSMGPQIPRHPWIPGVHRGLAT